MRRMLRLKKDYKLAEKLLKSALDQDNQSTVIDAKRFVVTALEGLIRYFEEIAIPAVTASGRLDQQIGVQSQYQRLNSRKDELEGELAPLAAASASAASASAASASAGTDFAATDFAALIDDSDIPKPSGAPPEPNGAPPGVKPPPNGAPPAPNGAPPVQNGSTPVQNGSTGEESAVESGDSPESADGNRRRSERVAAASAEAAAAAAARARAMISRSNGSNSSRLVGTPARTISQVCDKHVRNKLASVINHMKDLHIMSTPFNFPFAKRHGWPRCVHAMVSYEEVVPPDSVGGKRKSRVDYSVREIPVVTIRSAGAFNSDVERTMFLAAYNALEMQRQLPNKSEFEINGIIIRILTEDQISDHVDL